MRVDLGGCFWQTCTLSGAYGMEEFHGIAAMVHERHIARTNVVAQFSHVLCGTEVEKRIGELAKGFFPDFGR